VEEGGVRLTYLGHSAVFVETSAHTLLVDPFLSGNPLAASSADALSPDYILLTHAHSDHVGDTGTIGRRTGATVIATVEICNRLASDGLKVHGMNIGGSREFPFGRVRLTPAWHSSSFADGTYGGMPAGIVIEADGKRIYHAGDTALFGDMKLIGELGLDLALLPIGGNFTMDPFDAARAAELLCARRVVPIHYDTFEVIRQDPHQFRAAVEAAGAGECLIMEPGRTVEL
jgi:L-ascorbate metabolism protein UlaG (beta-lactamase superfamily)